MSQEPQQQEEQTPQPETEKTDGEPTPEKEITFRQEKFTCMYSPETGEVKSIEDGNVKLALIQLGLDTNQLLYLVPIVPLIRLQAEEMKELMIDNSVLNSENKSLRTGWKGTRRTLETTVRTKRDEDYQVEPYVPGFLTKYGKWIFLCCVIFAVLALLYWLQLAPADEFELTNPWD